MSNVMLECLMGRLPWPEEGGLGWLDGGQSLCGGIVGWGPWVCLDWRKGGGCWQAHDIDIRSGTFFSPYKIISSKEKLKLNKTNTMTYIIMTYKTHISWSKCIITWITCIFFYYLLLLHLLHELYEFGNDIANWNNIFFSKFST